jgi:chemotaxis protein methyltransferase CheR
MRPPALQLTPEVFTILNALIEERVGIHYQLGDRELMAHKVAARAEEAGFDSLLDYYYFLRYDPEAGEEFESLIDSLVVGETYFFREYDQLLVLVEEVIAPIVARGGRPRVWSAACATGEEPLTLAMLLADRGLLESCQLVASDVSRRAVDRAKAGRFGLRALRSIPKGGISDRWIVQREGAVAVRPGLSEQVQWRRINLLDAAAVAAVGPCDAILCRNVLIYFRDETTNRVIDSLTKLLPEDGALFVGISESLLRFAGPLTCEERRGVFLYRKQKATT